MAKSSTTKRTRLVDIAQRANVSPMTVSQVLNPRPSSARVSMATAERVRKIAKEMNYRPNLAARQLAAQSSKLIGAIIDSSAAYNKATSLAAMERYASKQGYRFIVGYTHDNYEQIAQYANDFLSRDVEGLVCLAHSYPEFGRKIPELFKAFENCVFVDPPLDESYSISYATIDYYKLGYIATKHLADLGRKKIAILIPSVGYRTDEDCIQGHRRALKESKLKFLQHEGKEALALSIDNIEDANNFISKFMKHKPDAFVVGSDESAMWIIRALKLQGYRVPEDIAIVSLELCKMGRAFLPSITGMDLKPEVVAIEAMRILIESIEKEDETQPSVKSSVIEPELVIGESCGAKKCLITP